jgi:hypothetical protein
MIPLVRAGLGILVGCAGIILVLCRSSIAQESELCYIKTASGQVVSLNKLCDSKSSSNVRRGSRMQPPGEVKINPNGTWGMMPGGDEPVQLPDGSTVYPDGRIALPGMEGFSMKTVVRNGESVGIQFYKPNGAPMQPDEFHKLSSGEFIEQKGFKLK